MALNMEELLWGKLVDYLITNKAITVSPNFHTQCKYVNEITENDTTGIINTILDYAVNSASETSYTIECKNQNLEDFLQKWLDNINIDLIGKVPTGISPLSSEYFKEIWKGSSLCILRAKQWEEVEYNGVKITVPKALYFVNGSSVYVKREDEKNYKLGTDGYYLDKSMTIGVSSNKDEVILVQKNGARWFDKYPIPNIVRNGIYKNSKAIQILQDKGDEVITKALPYLFMIKMGNAEMLKAGAEYKTEDLKNASKAWKEKIKEYKDEKGKVPTVFDTFDKEYSHLMPDYSNVLKQELYSQGYRALLAGLGFVDVIQGISSTRRESILNPKPFVAGVNAGVKDFSSLLHDLVVMIVEKNLESHPKYFGEDNEIKIVSSPLKINVEEMMEAIRSGFDRGPVSLQSYTETLGFNYDKEKERRAKELKDGDEDLMYPHLTQNREDIPDRMGIPAKPRNDKTDKKENKKPGSPEAQNFKAKFISKCSKCDYEFDYLSIKESGMGYVKCPKCEEPVTQKDIIEEAESKYYRIRQIDPSKFEEDSFRIIVLSESKGIKAVIGRIKGEKKTSIQSYLFDKEIFSEDEANKWVTKHGGKVQAFLELSIDDYDLEMAPYTKQNYPDYLNKYPEGARTAWIDSFNSALKQNKGEDYAFRVAWSVLNKWLKSHGYKKDGDKWIKKSRAEAKSEEIKEKQSKLLDKLLGEKNETI